MFGKDKVIKKMLKTQRFNAKDVIYVGDETRDIDAAKQAKVTIIAVTWGFNTAKALTESSPNFLAHNPRELLEIVEKL